MRLKIQEILNATKGKLVCGNPDMVIEGISTDSRTLQKDELFVALSGEKFDGHDFFDQVLEKGGMGAVVSHAVDVDLPVIIEVNNTLRAYGDIANVYRKKFDIPIVAITGSNGKTTTKNMTASILSQRFYVLSPEKSFNNQVGVPATLLKLNENHEVAVIELGTNMPGEIERLTQIVEPNIGVITNIAATHLEKLKSVEGVAKEKSSLLKSVKYSVLNADDDYFEFLASKASGEIVTFSIKRQEGKEENNQRTNITPTSRSLQSSRITRKSTTSNLQSTVSLDTTASNISLTDDGRPKFNLIFNGNCVCKVLLPCLGEYNIYNALAAANIGKIMDLDYAEIKAGLENYKPAEMRMQPIYKDGITFINDAYNSNPRSLSLALEYFSRFECRGKKIAVLADMLELGECSAQLHRQIGENMPSSISVLITVGDYAKMIAEGAENRVPNVYSLQNNLEVSKLLNEIVNEGDVVLFKGSRNTKLEEVLEKF